MVEHVAATLIRAIIIPATWWQTRQMRKTAAITAAQVARRECGCGICAVTDLLDAPINTHTHRSEM